MSFNSIMLRLIGTGILFVIVSRLASVVFYLLNQASDISDCFAVAMAAVILMATLIGLTFIWGVKKHENTDGDGGPGGGESAAA